MDDQDIVQEFLVESDENLARLDLEMVELERQPGDRELLGSIFRTIHTIKGTCGFLGFVRLEALAHVTETLLSDVRCGKRELDTSLTTFVFEAVDGIKRILASIQASGAEGEIFEAALLSRLDHAVENQSGSAEAVRLPESPPISPAPDIAPPIVSGAEGQGAKPVPAANAAASADATLRVDVNLLDRLMNLVGELVLTRNQVLQYNAAREDAVLNVISQRMNLITTELQSSVMKTRMQPIGRVWSKLPRIVRDLATGLQKEIAVEMDGAETELDRTIIDAIKDPLTHIVRNSCDHGIETPRERVRRGKPARGHINLRAFHEGGQVNIEIADDGSGIDVQRVRSKAVERGLVSSEQAQRLSDRDAVNFVFMPGFSTAASVTNISGRGVGMDVVRTQIERIGGTVDLQTQPEQGTTVRVRIPLTLAIIPGLIVSAGGERFVIPQVSLHELVRLEGDAIRTRIEHIHSTPVYRRRNALLPLTDLSEILRLNPRRTADERSIVVLQADEHRFGLIVDSISDCEEIVVKPLSQQLKGLNCYAGATIMGDGKIALILDVAGLGQRAGVIAAQGNDGNTVAGADSSSGPVEDRKSLLLFRAGAMRRLSMPLAKVARLEKLPRSSVEHAAGREVVQYRGSVLPLVSLADMFGGTALACAEPADPLDVVVYRHQSTDVGLVVDEIIDIVEENVGRRYGAERSGLAGSAEIGGKMTDFLDLDAVVDWAGLPSAESLARLNAALCAGGVEAAVPEVIA